jgi:hypothetical protein
VLIWLDIQATDQDCFEKFDDEYRDYLQRVSQVNFTLGVIRLISQASEDIIYFLSNLGIVR